MITICAGSSSGEGKRPEYQRSIGGSHGAPPNATIAWPATRRTNSVSSAQSRGTTKSGTDHDYLCCSSTANSSDSPFTLFRSYPCESSGSGFDRGGNKRGLSLISGLFVAKVHALVVPVPLALEELVRVVLALELEELRHLRVAGVDLAAQRVAVVGGVVAAAVAQPEVDQAPQRVGAADHPAGGVLDVQVEDDAGVGLARPGEEALAVLLDQAHRAVDDVPGVHARVLAHLGHEALELLALDVDLADRLGRLPLRVGHLVDGAVVVLRVEAHLALVGPVELPVGGHVVRGVALERLALVGVREEQELGPLALAQLVLQRRHRPGVVHGAVAREHAPLQEVVGLLVDGILEVAVGEAVADAAGESLGEAGDLAHLDAPLELAPRHEPQGRRVDETEQAVAADRQAKEVGIFLAAAVQEVAAPRDEPERLDVVDERRHGEAAAVDVGGQAAADGDFVYAGLLLRERPGLARGVGLVRGIHRHDLGLQKGEDLRPLDARLDLEPALFAVEREHPVELADVEHHGVGAELLAAHGVAP